MNTPLMKVSNLRKTYGPRVVLDDIDLEVDVHDVICLIGSSGSGKSTLLRCLDLLEDVDDGVIEFEGREVSDPRIDKRAVRQRMGMVFQAYNLFRHLTVLDNVTLAPRRVHGVAQTANFTPYVVAGVLFVLLALPLIAVTDWVTLRAARRQNAGA